MGESPANIDHPDTESAGSPTARTDVELSREFLATRDASCPSCGYNLRGTKGGKCSECGHEFQLGVGPAGARAPHRWLPLVILLVLIADTGYKCFELLPALWGMILDVNPQAMVFDPWKRATLWLDSASSVAILLISLLGLAGAIAAMWLRDARGSYTGYRWVCWAVFAWLSLGPGLHWLIWVLAR